MFYTLTPIFWFVTKLCKNIKDVLKKGFVREKRSSHLKKKYINVDYCDDESVQLL